MNNLRIVADNAIARATLTASNTAGALVVTNLQAVKKSSVWRGIGTSETLTAVWPTLELLSCVALPFCDLSPTATARVRGYSDAAGSNLVLDTGAVLACPAPAIRLVGWTAAQSASAYAYGGGACAVVWFAPVSVMRLVVDIVDTANLQGYIEAAYLVAGQYWATTYNPTTAPTSQVDLSTDYRSGAGDLLSEVGTVYKKLSIDLEYMPASDRATMTRMLRNSRAYPIFMSVFPGNADLELERDYTIYGKRTADSEIAIQYATYYSTKVEIQSV